MPAPETDRNVTVNLQAFNEMPEHYCASVFVAEPLTPDEYKEVAKSIGDEHFRGASARCAS